MNFSKAYLQVCQAEIAFLPYQKLREVGKAGVKMNYHFSASRFLIVQRKKRHVSSLVFT